MNRLCIIAVLCVSPLISGQAFGDIIPSPGHYEGTTSQGKSVSFGVTATGEIVDFRITINYSCNTCSGSKEMPFPFQQFTIIDTCYHHYVFAPNNFEFGGCFVTETTVSGFFYYISDQECGPCNDFITYDAYCLDCATSLTVLAPNGGERWTVDELRAIEWRSTGQVSDVRIDYSFDGGGSWFVVTDSTDDSGTFLWTVPNTPSQTCLVLIRDVIDPTIVDMSDDLFSICSLPSITIHSPRGGERWKVGERDTIKWTWQGCIDSVTIEFTVNGSASWTLIAEGIPNVGIYEWSIPNAPSEEAYVRVSDVTNETISDVSDEPFRICLPSRISVQSPNGEEEWVVGSSQLITWASTGCIDEVSIAYSTDSGFNWIEIVLNTANTDSFPWTVPNTPSSECLIKVWDADDPTGVDVSDATFTICRIPTLTILWPDGGEVVFIDSVYDIRWQSIGCVDAVAILYSLDAGQNWISISDQTPNDGVFSWTIPDTPSPSCLVRIHAFGDSVIFDVSDSFFAIEPTPALTVLVPNGGEELWVGQTFEVMWDAVGMISAVMIDYTTDGGSNWSVVADSTANSGSFEWILPPTPSSQCLIRIADEATGTVADVSDSFFTIKEPKGLSLFSPNGGEVWDAGGTHDVLWSSTGAIDGVGIAYSLNGGGEWVLEGEDVPNEGAYTWVVPDTFSEECLLRIFDASDPDVADTSDSFFTIIVPSQLTLLSPKGGEEWIVGSQHGIQWTSRGFVDSIAILYSFTGGLSWISVVERTVDDGEYEWTIPPTPSLVCLVCIHDPDNPEVADTSDNFFAIRSAPSITVLAPNGGEEWRVGAEHDIEWLTTGFITDVTISYTTAFDAVWEMIVPGTPSDGSFLWRIPNTPSTQCRILIFDADVPEVTDTSDAFFTILPLEVTLRAGDGSGNQGTSDNRVPVEVENGMSLGRLHFSLSYESNALLATKIIGTERIADMSRFVWSHTAPGSLGITIDEGIIASDVGPILWVGFDIPGNAQQGEYPIHVYDCSLGDTLMNETFLCLTEGGIFTVYPREAFSLEGFLLDAQGIGLEGVTVTLMGDTSYVVATSASGQYQFDQLLSGDYVILPSRACWTFQPPSRRYYSLDERYEDQNFVGLTLGRASFGWGEGDVTETLSEGALEDTFAVWFGPSLPCSLHAVEMKFGSPGIVMMFVWEVGSDAPNDGIAPARGTFSFCPLGNVVVGPIPFTVQGTGDWERFDFDNGAHGPVFGGPEEPGRPFFVGWVKVVPGFYPDNVPHILGLNVFPEMTHSWFGGPWMGPGGVDPKDHPWGAYDSDGTSGPNMEYAVRLEVTFPWCPSFVSVGMPDTRGDAGDTLAVPIYVYSVVSGMGIRSYACDIAYDETVLEFVDCISQPGDMARDWDEPSCQIGTPSILSLSQGGVSDLVGSGIMVHIRFRLLSGWKECSDLTFVNFSFDEGDPPVHSENGRICVEAGEQRCRISGYVLHYSNDRPVEGADMHLFAGYSDAMRTDETGFYLFDRLLCSLNDTVCASVAEYPSNGVTAYDAALVAQAAVGRITPSPLQQIAGDVSANCAVSAYDAALIAQRAAGLLSSFPVGPWIVIPEKETITEENWCTAPSCLTHTPLAMDRDGQDFVAVPVGDISGNWNSPPGGMRTTLPIEIIDNMTAQPGQHLILPLSLDSEEGIMAVDVTFMYKADVISLDSVSRTEITKDFTMVLHTQSGRIDISLYGLTSVDASGALLHFWFTVVGTEGEVSPLKVERLLINEKPVPVAIAQLVVAARPPDVYGLEQNLPNPFNPETTIRYQIPVDDGPVHTKLRIYNVLGQEIRTLVDEIQGAGTYSVRWDGRDAWGHEVPSGVYFYRLTAGNFLKTRRMVYVR